MYATFVTYKEDSIKEVILLRGNHDMQHLGYSWAQCSGYDENVCKYMIETKNRFLNDSQWIYIDEELKTVFSHAGISQIWMTNSGISDIHEINNLTPSELVLLAKHEEKPFKIDDGAWDIKDLDDRSITKIQFEYKSFLDNKNLSNRTIKLKLDTFRALLGEYNIEKPKNIKIDIPNDRIREKDIVSWRDVEKAMNICKGIRDKSIISLMATSGLRGIDVVSMTIKTLVDACSI